MKKYFLLVIFLIIGTLLTQGFQCASPEVTTAKLAYRDKQYDKAKAAAEKAIAKNSKDAEAWLLLAESKQALGDMSGATEAIIEAGKNATDPKIKNEVNIVEYNIVNADYEKGTEFFNKAGSEDKAPGDLDTALVYYNSAKKLRPHAVDFYSVIGRVYELKGDTANAMENYNQFAKLYEGNISIAREKNLFKDEVRTDAMSSLGKPESSRGVSTQSGDSIYIDVFKINNKDLFLYSYKKNSIENPNLQPTVIGWKYDPPTEGMPSEREQPVALITEPYASLAQIYFERRDYMKSLENVRTMITVEPNNIDANAFLVNLYELEGKKDEALTFVKELINKNPANKYFRAQYGDMLMKMDKYNEAIEQYQKALEIDPNYVEVQRNIAAAYKNMAVILQKGQAEKKEKDPNYKENPEEYFPLLKKSAEYFEQIRKNPKWQNDIDVLSDLINIYEVVGEKDKMKQDIAEFEAIEAVVPQNQKLDYYYKLIKIYERTKESEKSAKIQEKIKELEK